MNIGVYFPRFAPIFFRRGGYILISPAKAFHLAFANLLCLYYDFDKILHFCQIKFYSMTVKNIGTKIKKALQEARITKEMVAKKTHKSRQQVHNWMNNTSCPRLDDLEIIMQMTGKDANYFFGIPSCNGNADKLRQAVALIHQALQKFEER